MGDVDAVKNIVTGQGGALDFITLATLLAPGIAKSPNHGNSSHAHTDGNNSNPTDSNTSDHTPQDSEPNTKPTPTPNNQNTTSRKQGEGEAFEGGGSNKLKPDPPGTRRNSAGRLIDAKTGRFVKDPNAKRSRYKRNKSERRKALLRDAKDPNSGLSNRARKQILDSNGNKVPYGYEVDHTIPLYTKKTNEGKRSIDVSDNMKTMRKSEHKKLHKPCNKVKYHKYPPGNY